MFNGVYTAIITPFTRDDQIDWDAYEKLLELQVQGGISGVVPAGTTGESPTINVEEQKKLIKFTVEKINKRIQVIPGTGGNSTHEAIELTKYAKETGCDGVLLVAPYYNKPTQEGFYQHFKAISDAVDIPAIVYNIPGRTGKNIETSTMKRIAQLKNMVAVKEASGSISQMMDVIYECPADFTVLSGDDGLALPLIAAGGKGVISVISNLIPEQMVRMVDHALNEDIEKARNLHYELKPWFDIEFIETNPIPIKYMLAKKNLIEETYRLPMCPLSETSKQAIDKLFEEMNM